MSNPENDPFQELAENVSSADTAIAGERQRCASIVQHALDQAAARGLPPGSPTVRILASLKHAIVVG